MENPKVHSKAGQAYALSEHILEQRQQLREIDKGLEITYTLFEDNMARMAVLHSLMHKREQHLVALSVLRQQDQLSKFFLSPKHF